MNRKVISLTRRHLDNGDDQLIALCDDGTMWLSQGNVKTCKWNRLPDIPQPDITNAKLASNRKPTHKWDGPYVPDTK
jgi:hypothetical protein